MSGDDDVIARAKRGDQSAFSELVRTHQRRVYATALHIMGNHAEADDVAQDAFIRAFRGLESFDGRADFFTWLYRITVNTALNHIRTRKRVDGLAREGARKVAEDGGRPESLGQQNRTPGEWAELGQEVSLVLSALAELSETLRVTLVLATVEGLPYRKIAEILEIPEGTVAWRINEARKQLRARLGATDEPALDDLASPQETTPKKALEDQRN